MLVGSSGNEPRLNSDEGIVRLNGVPDVDRNVMSMTAGRDEILEHSMPYAPAEPCGIISGDTKA